MSQILVRNVPEDVAERLKQRAKRNRRSLQAEVGLILEEAVNAEQREAERLAERQKRIEEFLKFANEMAEASGPQTSDSVDLIREDRDR